MSVLSKVSLYWHTIRYLKPVQIYGRIWFKLAKPSIDCSPAPQWRVLTGRWVTPAQRRPSMTGPDKLFFLNQERLLSEIGWDDFPGPEKLWRYNQHYFDDLNAQDAARRYDWHMLLLNNWVEKQSLGSGTGWEPYPTSIRIVNWTKWVFIGNTLPPACTHSLAIQARWLSKRLEWHLLGNHLFANAKALVFAGVAFEGKEGKRWIDTGLKIIERELREQVLPDGGHFERSTMYHSIFIEDILDLINLARAFPGCFTDQVRVYWEGIASRMLIWLEGMIHPDGEISFFNDAAIGVAPSPDYLFAYASRLNIGSISNSTDDDVPIFLRCWKDSGYARLSAPDAVAIIDVAPVGPDYLPGHSHADTLSFELSLFGHRVIVNGGTSCYGLSANRLLERQTRSHSTVEIDGKDSSEVWGGFRVARRAYPFGVTCKQSKDEIFVKCSHDGYRRLGNGVVHKREWTARKGKLEVHDFVEQSHAGVHVAAVARYLIHPDVKIEQSDKQCWCLFTKNHSISFTVCHGQAEIEQSKYSPEFGLTYPAQCIAVSLVRNEAKVVMEWD